MAITKTCIVIPVTWPGTSGDGVVGTLSTTSTQWDAALTRGNQFFSEVSYAAFQWVHTRIAPVVITAPTDTSDIAGVAAAAGAAATSAGHDPAPFDCEMYIVPDASHLPFSAAGITFRPTPTHPVILCYSGAFNTASNWRTFVHEQGHALGVLLGTDYPADSIFYPLLPHSAELQPPNTSSSFDPALVTAGRVVEYGNQYDVMANAVNGGHFCARQKKSLGWMPAGSMQTVTASGTYTVSPLESASGIRALVISDGSYTNIGGTWPATWWVEFRDGSGFDSVNVEKPAVLVYLIAPSYLGFTGTALLLDMQPANQPTLSDFSAGLPVGSTFTTPNGLSIKNVAVGSSASITVTLRPTGAFFGILENTNLGTASDTETYKTTLEKRIYGSSGGVANRPFGGFRNNGGWGTAGTGSPITDGIRADINTAYSAGRLFTYVNDKPDPIAAVDGTQLKFASIAAVGTALGSGPYDPWFNAFFSKISADGRWDSSNPYHYSFWHEQAAVAEGGGSAAGTPQEYRDAFRRVAALLWTAGFHASQLNGCFLLCFVPEYGQFSGSPGGLDAATCCPIQDTGVGVNYGVVTQTTTLASNGHTVTKYCDVIGGDLYSKVGGAHTFGTMASAVQSMANEKGTPWITGELGCDSGNSAATFANDILTFVKANGSGSGRGQCLALLTTPRIAAGGDYRFDVDFGNVPSPIFNAWQTTITDATFNAQVNGSPLPAITSFAPASGVVGTVVTITGTSFTGATAVTIGSVNCPTFTVNSDTRITVTIPPSAVTGAFKVTTAAGTSPASSTSFTVTVATRGLVISGPQASQFSIATDGLSGQTIISGASKTATIVFSPPAGSVTNASATLTITDSTGTAQTQPVTLSGTPLSSTGVGTVAPSSQNFGTVLVGQTSSNFTFTLTNTGGNPSTLSVASVALTGANPGQFAIVSDTGQASLGFNQARSVVVNFHPTSGGSKSASLSFTDNSGGVAGTVQSASLTGTAGTGTGIATVTPASPILYPNTSIGQVSTRTVTVTNTGAGNLTISTISISPSVAG